MKNNTLILASAFIVFLQCVLGFYMLLTTDLDGLQTMQFTDKTLFHDLVVYSLISGVGAGWVLWTALKESSRKVLSMSMFLLIFIATWIALILRHTIIIAITHDAFAIINIVQGLSAAITLTLCPTINDAIIKDEETITILDKDWWNWNYLRNTGTRATPTTCT